MSGPPAPNVLYSISSDQYLLSAMNTFIHLESNVSYRVSRWWNKLPTFQIQQDFEIEQKDDNLGFKPATADGLGTMYGQHTFKDD